MPVLTSYRHFGGTKQDVICSYIKGVVKLWS
ncbi:hypothetical protein C8N37_106253 [Sphingobacterium faecium]|nr:hypothetical protein C8N37_106253 [Sphingobacterium faecium]